ncbi:MAG: hypothetical protein JOZ69_09005 [Myxococcales bacterium]|nr:hypothetical protein [Myxococcales bacterium]
MTGGPPRGRLTPRPRARLGLAAIGALVACGAWGAAPGGVVWADTPPNAPPNSAASATPSALTVDRTAARFYAPETGGTAYPRFVSQRTLAFMARLQQMAEVPEGFGEDYAERDVRAALDRVVAEEMLANLADRLIADSPPDRRPTGAELREVEERVSRAIVERVGGRPRVDQAARAEQLDDSEVNSLLRRCALAAWYVDRALSPILHPTDEQLRDVLRTSANPYRGRRFSEVRDALERWYVAERVRATEDAFLQAARSRVKVVLTR